MCKLKVNDFALLSFRFMWMDECVWQEWCEAAWAVERVQCPYVKDDYAGQIHC